MTLGKFLDLSKQLSSLESGWRVLAHGEHSIYGDDHCKPLLLPQVKSFVTDAPTRHKACSFPKRRQGWRAPCPHLGHLWDLTSTLLIVLTVPKWAPLKAGFQAAGVCEHGNILITAGTWPGTQICQCGRQHSLPRKAAWRHRLEEGKIKNKEWSCSVLKLKERHGLKGPSILLALGERGCWVGGHGGGTPWGFLSPEP